MLHQLSKEVPNRDEIVKHNRLTSYTKRQNLYTDIAIRSTMVHRRNVHLNEKKVLIAIGIALLMVLSGFVAIYSGMSGANHVVRGSSTLPVTPGTSSAPWTYPTTTMQEPGYTNGTYNVATVNNIGHESIYLYSSLYAAMVFNEIYDSATNLLPNDTIVNCLATSYSSHNVTAQNMKTWDPLTQSYQDVNYTWIVHIRPGVQWTDINSTNAADTYVYSNHTTVYNTTGAEFNHTYKWSSVTMKTHYVQSADFIISWEILNTAFDYSGEYSNVVNVIPINNLTVEYQLSSYSAEFLTYTLETAIIPYHIWDPHIFADTSGFWNYNATWAATNAGMGYNDWELGYSPTTGYAPDLIGSGPFMMNGGYGMPKGYILENHGWQLYVNPHWYGQYTNASAGLRQYTPKIWSIDVKYYTSASNEVSALVKGEVATIIEGVGPNFVPTVETIPFTYIYHKPSTTFGIMQVNSLPSDAPFNITALRQALNYATNKAYLASVVDSGYEILGQPSIPPSDPLWRNDTTPSYAYNPTKAEQLISSIPGMTNVSGEWYYHGKQVTANIQITPSSETPLAVEGALLTQGWWDAIGIKTSITYESFTTLVPNLEDYHYNVIELAITGITGDPTGDLFAFYNNASMGTGFYEGPFSSITFDGVHYTGKQIDSLMNNLTVEMNGNYSLSQRIKISDEIQGIAAIESVNINPGYPVDILPFTNSTFANISRTSSLPYAGYMYWAFMTVHKRSTPLVSHITSHLDVSVSIPSLLYYNGQYANVTITVTNNKTSSPVSGASVYVGYNPTGALLNITSDTLTTDSSGVATWEFQVLNSQTLVYTNAYTGMVNISAVASVTTSGVGPGLGYNSTNVVPRSLMLKIAPTPVLISGSAKQLYTITVENGTGSPLSGFSYELQALNGAVIISPALSGQTVSYSTTPYISANDTNNPANNNVTSISGVTGSNGTIEVYVQANSSFNFAALGSSVTSYLFFGSIVSGAPVGGLPGYMLPAEMTTANNAGGFGVQQVIEFPITIASSAPTVKLNVTESATTIAYNGSLTVSVKVTNSTGSPLANTSVDLMLQNIFGANRGYFYAPSGVDQLFSNPNAEFGSLYLQGIVVKTDSHGFANVTFYPNIFTYSNASSPVFTNVSYTGYVPADSWIVTVEVGNGSTVASGFALSSRSSTAPTPTVTPPPPHKVTPPAPFPWLYVIIAVVVIVAVIGAVAVIFTRKKSSGGGSSKPPQQGTN